MSHVEALRSVNQPLGGQAEPAAFALGELRISYDRRRVTLPGRELRLTAREYDLLTVLSRNAGRVMINGAPLHQMWGKRGGDNPGPVRTFVRTLRHKLGDDAASPHASSPSAPSATGRMARPGER